MTPEMITAIGALVAAVGGLISAILLNRKTVSLLSYRMDIVEKKLDLHNGYAKLFSETGDRIAKIEQDVAVIKTAMEFLRNDVEKD